MSTAINLIQAFELTAPNYKITAELAKRIQQFEREFVNRNQDHVDFFSGYLLGVHRVIMRESDFNRWFDDIIHIDDVELYRNIMRSPDFNPEWKVTGDAFNVSCMYLVHRFMTDTTLPERTRNEAIKNSLLIFHYKILTSILANSFKYLTNKETAEAVYAQMSKKYSLKKYGSWSALLHSRVEAIVNKKSIHFDALKEFSPDKGIMYAISDSQGRIRGIIRLQYDILIKTLQSDKRIVTTSDKLNIDGEELIRDITRTIPAYRDYLKSVVGTRTSFVKDDIIRIIASAQETMSPVMLRDTLNYFSDNYLDNLKEMDLVIEKIIVHAFTVLKTEHKSYMRSMDLPFILIKLRGSYTSARGTDQNLLDLRQIIDELVMKATHKRSPNAVASVRTGFLLYCVVRAIAKDSY